MSDEKSLEKLKTFTNKQVLSIVIATAFIVFTAAGIWGTFNGMSSKITTLESDMITLEKEMRKDFDADLKALRDNGEMGFELIQRAIDASNKLQTTNYDNLYMRVSNIRDRTDETMDKIEKSISDK